MTIANMQRISADNQNICHLSHVNSCCLHGLNDETTGI